MFKFIKNLFTKKKRFTLDDLDLSRRVDLKFMSIKKEGYRLQVYFWHPLYKELWPMPSRTTSIYSKWTLLKKGKIHSKNEGILTVGSWYSEERNVRERFATVNHLRIYFESLERQYNELHP
jgi:hypothetical protein